MRTVFIMRHGKSRWNEEGVEDHDRSLAKRGKRDVRCVGEEIRVRGFIPDIILSSTAKRARSTARRVAKAVGYEGDIRYEEGLYYGGIEACLAILSSLPDTVRSVMIIGHNPLLEALVEVLTDEVVELTPSALARVDLSIDAWSEVNWDVEGQVSALLSPDELKRTS